MKIVSLSIMAARYFQRYFRRYLFLFLALSFGYCIITSLTGLQAGMEENVYKSTQSHYTGDIVISGRAQSLIQFRISEVDKVLQVIQKSGIPHKQIVVRTQFGDAGVIYFNGAAVKQRSVMGVDWDNEASYFASLDYKEGSFGSWNKEDGIVVSSPVAEELGVLKGDSVLLEVHTRTGQINTGRFVIQAIVNDDTIFGFYKSYIDRNRLNDLIGFRSDEASSVGIYLKKGVNLEKESAILHEALSSSGLNTAPMVHNRDELNRELSQEWGGVRYFIITLPVYLSEVAELLSAIKIVSYFLYFLMILIIIVSVAVTFRLILHEREKEIGTLQSIGFHSQDVVFLLMMETFILFLCSLVTGFIFARLVIWIMGFVSFSMIPSFEIFMQGGRLVPVITFRTTLINSLIVLAAIIPTVALPVFSSSRKPLPQLLSGTQ